MPVERPWRAALGLCLAVLVLVAPPRIADAHPAPFSYIDVRIGDGPMHGRIVLHDLTSHTISAFLRCCQHGRRNSRHGEASRA
jgi:hypothetical protein